MVLLYFYKMCFEIFRFGKCFLILEQLFILTFKKSIYDFKHFEFMKLCEFSKNF